MSSIVVTIATLTNSWFTTGQRKRRGRIQTNQICLSAAITFVRVFLTLSFVPPKKVFFFLVETLHFSTYKLYLNPSLHEQVFVTFPHSESLPRNSVHCLSSKQIPPNSVATTILQLTLFQLKQARKNLRLTHFCCSLK